MSERQRVTLDPSFEVELPAGWAAEVDEDEGVALSGEDGPGLLHLIAFPQNPGEMPDPAEELYAFLEDQEIELQEDEIEDLDLGETGELSLCEYITEEDDEDGDEEGGATYWMVGVAVAPGMLVFCSYSCPAAEAEEERETVREILRTLRLRENP